MKRTLPYLRVFAFAAIACLGLNAHGQEYPTKPIRYIVIFPPGGPTDTLARLIAPRLGTALGQPVVVENHPGAAGAVGSAILAKAPPDGYTIGGGTISSHAINASVYRRLPYDPVKDFAPITMIATLPNVLVVNARVNVHSVGELIALLKVHPGAYSFGSGGIGTSEHLEGELFKRMTGVDMRHVPYNGSGPLMKDLIAGVVPVSFINIAAAEVHIKSGEVRALAVTSAERASALPDVPTMAEAGLKGYEITGWQALFAPAGTPQPIVKRLHDAVARILRDPDVVARIHRLGAEPGGMASDELGKVVRADMVRFGRLVKEAGIHVN